MEGLGGCLNSCCTVLCWVHVIEWRAAHIKPHCKSVESWLALKLMITSKSTFSPHLSLSAALSSRFQSAKCWTWKSPPTFPVQRCRCEKLTQMVELTSAHISNISQVNFIYVAHFIECKLNVFLHTTNMGMKQVINTYLNTYIWKTNKFIKTNKNNSSRKLVIGLREEVGL